MNTSDQIVQRVEQAASGYAWPADRAADIIGRVKAALQPGLGAIARNIATGDSPWEKAARVLDEAADLPRARDLAAYIRQTYATYNLAQQRAVDEGNVTGNAIIASTTDAKQAAAAVGRTGNRLAEATADNMKWILLLGALGLGAYLFKTAKG